MTSGVNPWVAYLAPCGCGADGWRVCLNRAVLPGRNPGRAFYAHYPVKQAALDCAALLRRAGVVGSVWVYEGVHVPFSFCGWLPAGEIEGRCIQSVNDSLGVPGVGACPACASTLDGVLVDDGKGLVACDACGHVACCY